MTPEEYDELEGLLTSHERQRPMNDPREEFVMQFWLGVVLVVTVIIVLARTVIFH